MKNIEYQIKYSKIKNIYIQIKNGQVIIKAPKRVSKKEIEKLIEYIEMIEKGPGTVKARKELLEEQRIKLIEKQKEITRNNRKTEL